jgi:hypothetical protein
VIQGREGVFPVGVNHYFARRCVRGVRVVSATNCFVSSIAHMKTRLNRSNASLLAPVSERVVSVEGRGTSLSEGVLMPTFVSPGLLGPTYPIELVPLHSRTCLHMCPLGCSLALKEGRSDAPLQPVQIR